jgi:hypothetical protein
MVAPSAGAPSGGYAAEKAAAEKAAADAKVVIFKNIRQCLCVL